MESVGSPLPQSKELLEKVVISSFQEFAVDKDRNQRLQRHWFGWKRRVSFALCANGIFTTLFVVVKVVLPVEMKFF